MDSKPNEWVLCEVYDRHEKIAIDLDKYEKSNFFCADIHVIEKSAYNRLVENLPNEIQEAICIGPLSELDSRMNLIWQKYFSKNWR